MANTTPTPDRRAATVDKNAFPEGFERFTDAQIKQAEKSLAAAFSLLGLVVEHKGVQSIVCPLCGTADRKKVQFKTSAKTGEPYWKCFKCPDPGPNAPKGTPRPWGGNAIEFLQIYGGRSFRQAVGELLGLIAGSGGALNVPSIEVSAGFQAIVDVEVYDFVRDAGDLTAAQQYWGRWHISPEVVAESGSTYLLDADRVQTELLERFGAERLRACGITTIDKNNKDVFLFNRDYPVIEVHQSPFGHVVGMQFRPSPERMKLVAAHKAWKRRWSGQCDSDGNELEPGEAWRRAFEQDQGVGRKAGYVTPFLSLKGGSPDHLVGCGLKQLVEIPRGSTVYVVEGFKDLLAARTMGTEAYAIPGTGVMPPERSVEILKLHKVVVMLDGDAAGAHGRQVLTEYLTGHGVQATPYPNPRDGMDVTDLLVERTAHAGCTCAVCVEWVTDHPYDPSTCPCRTCRSARR